VSDDAAVVRALFERFTAGEMDGAFELISEDIVVVVPASMSAEPDVYEGHEGVLRYLRGFDDTIENVRFEPRRFSEENGLLIVEMRLSGRGVTSGIEVGVPSATVVWVEDGRVTRLEPLPDLDTARERARAG